MAHENQTALNLQKKLPKPTHTAEFPSGLISDYIKLVDKLAPNHKQQKA
jgi:hypothetical protein